MWDVHAENLDEFLLHAEPVHVLHLVPLRERDDEVEAFLLADGLDAEHLRDIDDADAAHFHVVAREFGAGAKHFAPVHEHGFHHVVGHETVTAFDECEHGLTLADATFTFDNHADAKDVH